jgi:hypothetical protein
MDGSDSKTPLKIGVREGVGRNIKDVKTSGTVSTSFRSNLNTVVSSNQ